MISKICLKLCYKRISDQLWKIRQITFRFLEMSLSILESHEIIFTKSTRKSLRRGLSLNNVNDSTIECLDL